MTLESRINFLWSIATNRPKYVVKEKFIIYCNEYDNLEREPKVHEKLKHKEMFEKFAEYMSREVLQDGKLRR